MLHGRLGLKETLIILAIFYIAVFVPQNIWKYNPFEQKAQYLREVKINLSKIKNEVPLAINSPTEYDGLKKSDIYELRKKYVENSLFASKKYKPSDEVFGQIEDNKAWYGLNYSGCTQSAIGTEKVKEGPSEESRFINNPNMLIGLSCGGTNASINDKTCKDKNFWLTPKSLSYDGKTKTIKANYKMPYFQNCVLVGLNARDIGFNYAYANKNNNLKFENGPSITKSVYSFKDYIHLGQSCRLNGGCNNASPYQSEISFSYTPQNYPAEIKLRLWELKPANLGVRPDLNYIISIYK